MAGLSIWKALMRKSISACVAAIEIYNKPASVHREETFATLVVSAWEAILKARLVKDLGVRSIQVLEEGRTPTGKPSKQLRPRLNRSQNPYTISLDKAIERCRSLPTMPLNPSCEANLSLLVEIRDNASHYYNADRELARRVNEAGSAALRNFTTALTEWFDVSLGDQRFAILPLSFEPLSSAASLQPSKRSRQAANLIAFLDSAIDAAPHDDDRYAVSLRIETQLVGGRNKEATAVRTTSDPAAPAIRLSDEDFTRAFPMDYKALCSRLRKRSQGFKTTGDFHEVLKQLRSDGRLANERRLHPTKRKTTVMWCYADAMVDAVAKELLKKSPALPLLDGTAATSGDP